MDKMAELIREAAAKLGIEAIRLWPQMVALRWIQALFEFLSMIILASILFSVGIHCLRRAPIVDNAEGRRYSFEPNPRAKMLYIVGILSCVAGVITMFVIVSDFPIVVGTLFYPEASLVQKMIGK